MVLSLQIKRAIRHTYERAFVATNLPRPFLHIGAIFIHIPKAAGSSVAMGLYGCQIGHRTLREYLTVDRKTTESLFSFTVCRDPLDRLYSAFRFLKQGGMTRSDKAWAKRNLTPEMCFEEFVRERLNLRSVTSYIHFVPQHRFVERYHLGPVGVDLICRFESIENDFRRVCDRLQIDLELEQLNKSQDKTDIDLSPEGRAIVRTQYARDYWLFGY